MGKLRSGQKLKCEPCGREVIIDACGASSSSIWCCGKPMRSGRSRSTRTKKSRTSSK